MGDRARRLRSARSESASEVGAELMQRVARGDEAAFSQLYDLMVGPVFGLVRRIVRDPAQSEEVVQEVMVELWRSAAKYSPERGSATTWAMTLAHRRAVDRVRSAQAAADRDDMSAAATPAGRSTRCPSRSPRGWSRSRCAAA